MRVGKHITLCTNDETEHLAEWTLVSKSVCEANILQSNQRPDTSDQRPVHLYVALLKNQNRWEWMLEKATELGAASFTPIITKRTEAQSLRKPERLNRIIQEAAEQSGRTLLPELKPTLTLEETIKLPGNKYICTIRSQHPSKDQIPTTNNQILVGPEGGFTEEEITLAIENDAIPISLGTQTLRTETAAIIAASTLLSSRASPDLSGRRGICQEQNHNLKQTTQ